MKLIPTKCGFKLGFMSAHHLSSSLGERECKSSVRVFPWTPQLQASLKTIFPKTCV